MAGIVGKKEAKGVDFCGGFKSHYIIRSDIGYYMYSSDFHKGNSLEVYSIHPSCRGGDHYLCDTSEWYIIKNNTYRCVSDLTSDTDAEVHNLHPNCQGGDHYLHSYGFFYIIFQSEGKFRKTTNLTTDKEGTEHNLHPNCRDGLYYWGNSFYIYLVKPKGMWGGQYHRTKYLSLDSSADTFSFHPDVLNFIPGGLAVTHGPAFGKWDLITKISNDSDSPINWEEKIIRKVGYTKSKMSSIEHNWKVSAKASNSSTPLSEALVKFQFSLSSDYIRKSLTTDNENWEEASEEEKKITFTLEPHKKMYVWQYKLGFGKEDVLYCRDLRFQKDSSPPPEVPVPPAQQ